MSAYNIIQSKIKPFEVYYFEISFILGTQTYWNIDNLGVK